MFVIAVDTAAGLPKFEADSALPPGGKGGGHVVRELPHHKFHEMRVEDVATTFPWCDS